jgi:hypothetical protein
MKSEEEEELTLTREGKIAIAIGILMIIALVGIVVYVPTVFDSHIKDGDYCRQYAKFIDKSMSRYDVNPFVATVVCDCKYEKNLPGSIISGVTKCERRLS